MAEILDDIQREFKTFTRKHDDATGILNEKVNLLTEDVVSIQTKYGSQVGSRLDSIEAKQSELLRGMHAGEFSGRGAVTATLMNHKDLIRRPERLGVGQSFMFQVESKVISGLSPQVPQWTGDVAGLGQAELRVRSLLPVVSVTSGAIQFLQKTSFTSAAKVVAENTAKPEALATYVSVVKPLEAIAVWCKITRQTYGDLPELVSELQNELIYDVLLQEEKEVLKGTGTSPSLQGIYPLAVALTATPAAGANLFDELGLGIAQLASQGYSASGAVVNQADWATALTTKLTSGEYLMGSPGTMPNNRAWSIPVVSSPWLATGEWLVGDFTKGAKLYERESVNIQISIENQDDFIRNLATVLCEERVALAIRQANAFVKNGAGVTTASVETGRAKR